MYRSIIDSDGHQGRPGLERFDGDVVAITGGYRILERALEPLIKGF
jgi:hypothetical protein